MARSIAGLFHDRQAAERALEDLKGAGFDPAKMGVVMKDNRETREITDEHGTRSTEGAVAGGIVGGSVGALLAAAGALVIPGIGPFISGGILATVVAGGAAGWLVGGLAGLGIPKEEAEYYEGEVQQGAALVTVDAEGRDDEARAIMLRDGARDLRDRGFGDASPRTESHATTAPDGDLRVPVMEEQQTVSVPVQREQGHVERAAVTGDADTTGAFVERTIEVPLMAEEAVVGKRAHVVEEVRLHKEAVTETETVSDTVRKERVVVEGVDELPR